MSSQPPTDRGRVKELVLATLANVMAKANKSPNAPLTEATWLQGREAVIDSLGMISFVVDMEQAIEKEFGANLALFDEDMLSGEGAALTTVQSAIEHVSHLLEERRHA